MIKSHIILLLLVVYSCNFENKNVNNMPSHQPSPTTNSNNEDNNFDLSGDCNTSLDGYSKVKFNEECMPNAINGLLLCYHIFDCDETKYSRMFSLGSDKKWKNLITFLKENEDDYKNLGLEIEALYQKSLEKVNKGEILSQDELNRFDTLNKYFDNLPFLKAKKIIDNINK